MRDPADARHAAPTTLRRMTFDHRSHQPRSRRSHEAHADRPRPVHRPPPAAARAAAETLRRDRACGGRAADQRRRHVETAAGRRPFLADGHRTGGERARARPRRRRSGPARDALRAGADRTALHVGRPQAFEGAGAADLRDRKGAVGGRPAGRAAHAALRERSRDAQFQRA